MARPKGSLTRAPGMTQISISLPQKLVEQIDILANEQNRNRSNFIVNSLSNLAKESGMSPSISEDKKTLKDS